MTFAIKIIITGNYPYKVKMLYFCFFTISFHNKQFKQTHII